jgi:hypothetical protein
MHTESPLIFLSYASPDRDRVAPYFDYLSSRGVNAWIDFKRLVAGQDWDREIKRSLDKSTMIILFLSINSVDRRGYVQRELRASLDKQKEKLFDDIYIIPVLLDDIPIVPADIAALQCVKARNGESYEEIYNSIQHQLLAIGAQVQQAQDSSKVLWSNQVIREFWDGLPGYEADLRILTLSSTKYPEVQGISDLIRGRIIELLMTLRQIKLNQDPGLYSFGQDKYSRCHTLDIVCSDPVISGRMITVQYSAQWFTLGAHGNTIFCAEIFTLDPVTRVGPIESIFRDPEGALTIVQSIVRNSLLNPEQNESGVCGDQDWVFSGTEGWDSFRCAILQKEGIEFIFPQYQVDCYAAGVKFAFVAYNDIYTCMQPFYLTALDIAYLAYLPFK